MPTDNHKIREGHLRLPGQESRSGQACSTQCLRLNAGTNALSSLGVTSWKEVVVRPVAIQVDGVANWSEEGLAVSYGKYVYVCSVSRLIV